MGRLFILIFLKLTNVLLLAHFTVSAPVRIHRDTRVKTEYLQLDLTQTETLVSSSSSSSVSLQTQRLLARMLS